MTTTTTTTRHTHPFLSCSGVRPFGVSLLIAGTDGQGHHLYQVDPSGTFFAWKASAIGKNMVNAKTFLEKRYSATMEIEDAVHNAILTLKEGMDGALDENLIEGGVLAYSLVYSNSLTRSFFFLSTSSRYFTGTNEGQQGWFSGSPRYLSQTLSCRS